MWRIHLFAVALARVMRRSTIEFARTAVLRLLALPLPLVVTTVVCLGVHAQTPDRARSAEIVGAYRVTLTITSDSMNPAFAGTYTVILDLERDTIKTNRLSKQRFYPYRRIAAPNACFYMPGQRVQDEGIGAGLAHWSVDSTGDTVNVLLQAGVDNGLAAHFPVGQSLGVGRATRWGHGVLTQRLGPTPGSILEEGVPVSFVGKVEAKRTSGSDLQSCLTRIP